MESKAVSDTGPIIHLTEINSLNVLGIFSKVIIPKEVENELKKNKTAIPSKIKVAEIDSDFKDKIKILVNQHDLNLGEAEAIVLALQEKTDYFLTDDLDARQVAKEFNISVHGTVGLILRAFKEKIIDKGSAINKAKELKTKSTLFITQDLIDEIIKAINDFSKG